MNENGNKKLVMLNGDYNVTPYTPEHKAKLDKQTTASNVSSYIGMSADLFSNIFTKVSDNRTAEALQQMKIDDKRLTNELTVALRNADASANATERDGYLAQIQALQLQQQSNSERAMQMQQQAPKEPNYPVIVGTGAVGVGILYLLLRKK